MVDGVDDLRVLREGALFQIVFHSLHEDPALLDGRLKDNVWSRGYSDPFVLTNSEKRKILSVNSGGLDS